MYTPEQLWQTQLIPLNLGALYPGQQTMLQFQGLLSPHIQQQTPIGMGGALGGIGVQQPFYYPSSVSPLLPGQFPQSESLLPHTISYEMAFQRPLSSADDETLAQAVYNGKGSLEETLLRLDGVNNHSTIQWTAHFIKNYQKVMREIEILKTASSALDSKASTFTSRKTDRPLISLSSHRPQARTRVVVDLGPNRHVPSPPPVPPPPTIITRPQGGNKYTTKDRLYFEKFITHVLKYDRNALDRPSIVAEKLAKLVPHHTHSSWLKYIRKHEDVVQQIRSKFLSQERHSESSDPGENEGDVDIEVGQQHEEPTSDSEVDEREVSLSSSESEGALRARDKRLIRRSGGRSFYLPSELRALAKHIASITLARWDKGGPDSYGNAHKKWWRFYVNHRNHNLAAWKKYYSQNAKEIRRMARRFEIRDAKRRQVGNIPAPRISSHVRGPKEAGDVDNLVANQ